MKYIYITFCIVIISLYMACVPEKVNNYGDEGVCDPETLETSVENTTTSTVVISTVSSEQRDGTESDGLVMNERYLINDYAENSVLPDGTHMSGHYYIKEINDNGFVLAISENDYSYDSMKEYIEFFAWFSRNPHEPVVFSSYNLEPLYPLQLICSFEDFVSIWNPETDYYVSIVIKDGRPTVYHVHERQVINTDTIFQHIEEFGDRLVVTNWERIYKSDLERIAELKEETGVELQEADFNELGRYYRCVDDDAYVVYLTDATRYYVTGWDGAKRCTKEDLKHLEHCDFKIYTEEEYVTCIIAFDMP